MYIYIYIFMYTYIHIYTYYNINVFMYFCVYADERARRRALKTRWRASTTSDQKNSGVS